ncbi:EF-hand superfamily Ca2+-modulated protein [Aspergillus saccharolyticus JOP 1030-1]|uniref:Calmodulin n=1 Tax=Aspergillus saccharolyticus JOP 1030-1 TaxID=1450539 RepID=A0A318ZPM5_9EURO|nr:EF-hand superfamily Ca2+-modulated protein [Aspergillus saccharolyticus JOP 1030-1]PYH49549.1 EF-hand superfamily Ca2+-modulated protein [Aspergillus saccharolyticus JOP 1030-1]
MPPKARKRGAPGATTTNPSAPKRARQSKLAKENNITAAEESEIKEVFHLFAVDDVDEFADEKEGVILVDDVKKALSALGLPPTATELPSILSALDPTETGYVPYEPFLTVAAAKLRSRSDEAMAAEVDTAFRLFVGRSGGGRAEVITLHHLRRIARELKEEANVDDQLLRDMILEANGGAGVGAGVTLGQFRDVMQRAGVF